MLLTSRLTEPAAVLLHIQILSQLLHIQLPLHFFNINTVACDCVMYLKIYSVTFLKTPARKFSVLYTAPPKSIPHIRAPTQLFVTECYIFHTSAAIRTCREVLLRFYIDEFQTTKNVTINPYSGIFQSTIM
jgi:hypothetical protein